MASLPQTRTTRPVWKVHDEQKDTQHVDWSALHLASKFFAVDASGSTAGGIIRREQDFVRAMVAHGEPETLQHRFCLWGSYCDKPAPYNDRIQWSANKGGTQPAIILRNQEALAAIDASDVFFLLTDGEIWAQEVPMLCQLAAQTGVINIPTVFVITQGKPTSPADLNISVGVSFCANAKDVLVLFKDFTTSKLYIVAAKGCFAPLLVADGTEEPDLTRWTSLKTFAGESQLLEHFRLHDIRVRRAASRPKLVDTVVDLGVEWAQRNPQLSFDIDIFFANAGLLDLRDLEELLADEAFANLSIACKTRGRLGELRAVLQAQKVEEINVKLEDVAGASGIVAQLADSTLDTDERTALQQRLREAHATNRAQYATALKDLAESADAQAVKQRNRLTNDALQRLAEVESAGYTADLLSRRSNRAKRAATVAVGGEISVNSLDLSSQEAFRAECRVCCGEDEVMSIVIKQGADGAANTDNFALDFPLAAGRHQANLDLISSQCICFQCALAMQGRTLFREEVAGLVPTLGFSGNNKKHIQEQLYLSLTGGLATGASGVSQMFMAMLDGVMETKTWAQEPSGGVPDDEVHQRRAVFQWMLDELLLKTGCRETFNEQGKFVDYPKALAWAGLDFDSNGIESWVVGYPTTGFEQLLRFASRTKAIEEAKLRRIMATKLFHSIASAYLALVQKRGWQDVAWRQAYLELIFDHFNDISVPVDRRNKGSLVNDPAEAFARLAKILPDSAKQLALFTPAEQHQLTRRIQVLVFWLHYTQLAPTKAKTFFNSLLMRQPLAATVLSVNDPNPLADSIAVPILISIFRVADPMDEPFAGLHAGVPPFVSPFGLSVLRCSFPGCGEWFLERDKIPTWADKWSGRQIDELREARGKHLERAFGVREAAPGVVSGMPQPVPADGAKAPASTHINLHISVARVWDRVDPEIRKGVVRGEEKATESFIRDVVTEICQGRRGDIFQSGLAAMVRELLPSFLQSLRKALVVGGDEKKAVEDFVHDWKLNTLVDKAKWELALED